MYVFGIVRNSNEIMFTLSASYFSDLALPSDFYSLLVVSEDKVSVLQKWWVKAGIVLLMAVLAEVSQYFGLNILGQTFDPIDIIMYAVGVLTASLIDWIFSIIFKLWKIEMKKK